MFEEQVTQAKLTVAVLASIAAGISLGFALKSCGPPSALEYKLCSDICAPHPVASVSQCECGP